MGLGGGPASRPARLLPSLDLGFTPPSLHYVAAGLKTLDARSALDPRYAAISAGDVVQGLDGVHSVLMRVLSAVRFEWGFGEGWAYYASIGKSELLVPTAWVEGLGRQVHDIGSAQAFYDALVPARGAMVRPVVVFEL